MARKMRSENGDSSELLGNSTESPQSKTAESGGLSLSPRMSVQLNAEGGIAWDRIQERTRTQLRKVLADPSLSAQLGVAAPGITAPAAGAFDPAICSILFDSLSSLMVAFAQRTYPADVARVVAFTPDEKAMLADPTAAVLNKYAGLMGKYQEEMVLLFALSSVVSGKLALLRATAAAQLATPQYVPQEQSAA